MELFRRLILRLTPVRGQEWIAAILAEADYLEEADERMGWCVAAAWVAIRQRLIDLAPSLLAITLAAIMILVDWTWGALLPALVLIALSAATIRKLANALIVAGATLPVAHAIANWVPFLRPDYQYKPLDVKDWTILAAVAAMGCCAVQVAGILRAARRPHPA